MLQERKKYVIVEGQLVVVVLLLLLERNKLVIVEGKLVVVVLV